MKNSEKKYICIHGHFYQPPRENPWLEAIEREDSASPYHDWNERINMECYRANTAARLVDSTNRILTLRNNYQYFSFNFGPTLMQWIERRDPWVYRAILDADRHSVQDRGGHGNAIAQVYNHVIMPLANERDKITQVTWGMRDFEHRFGRRPEGMWLAETAVDLVTLRILADAGIKYTILSPYQAARWRFIDDDTRWRDAGGGLIPTGRAYRCDCGDGKHINLFFYDPALARGIAFERLLEHSSKLLEQLERAYSQRDARDDEPWLVHVATDGESYGHHFKFGDMALAAAFRELERDSSAEIENYGQFLASFPVIAEVEIFENTAWSCAHGLGRWSADCGCHIGGESGWNQKWRAPLREALNFVRDTLAIHFEAQMKKLCKDPWKARDGYLDVVLDRKKHLESFLRKHLRGGTASTHVSRFLELLEMQRFTLLMFTSCGWFFDEISQLESMLLLKYAAMAIDLSMKTGAAPIGDAFVEMLRRAPSNVAEYGNGANVFLQKVKPEIVGRNRVVANYAIHSLAVPSQRQFQIYTYGIEPREEEDLGSNPVSCLCGRVSIKDDRVLVEEDFLYAVLHFGGLDFRCSVKPYTGPEEYESILHGLQDAVEEQNTIKMVRVLDEKFGTEHFGLSDVFRDLRSSIALDIGRKTLSKYTDLQRSLFHAYKPIILSLRQWGITIPSDLHVPVRRVLSDEAEQLIEDILSHEEETLTPRLWDASDFFFRAHMARFGSLQEEAGTWGVSLKLESVSEKLGRILVETAEELVRTFDQRDAGRFFRLLSICTALDVKPETWKLQTRYFEFISRALENPKLRTKIGSIEKFACELDKMLYCRFARLLRELPGSPSSGPKSSRAGSWPEE